MRRSDCGYRSQEVESGLWLSDKDGKRREPRAASAGGVRLALVRKTSICPTHVEPAEGMEVVADDAEDDFVAVTREADRRRIRRLDSGRSCPVCRAAV